MIQILITGKDSFIGSSVAQHLSQWPDHYQTETIDMVGNAWRSASFKGYDVVFHVAGIAHSDARRISDAQKAAYYLVNTDLAIETARKAKESGIRQFIYMSSIIVYGNSAPIGQQKRIHRHTPVAPANCYGDSKVKAEEGLLALHEPSFRVVILRPPMIYGPGCKGNYPMLSKLARRMPLFPDVGNERSMLYVENLAEFVRLMIQNEEEGVFHPQNAAYVQTSELVKTIAAVHGKKLQTVQGFTWLLKLARRFTALIDKAFGNLSYDSALSDYKENYQICDLPESIRRTETAHHKSGR